MPIIIASHTRARFATADDIARRLGRTFTTAEADAAEMAIDAAISTVSSAAGKTDAWAASLDPVPNILRFVVIGAACRALANPEGAKSASQTLGQYQRAVSFNDITGIDLTDRERQLVRQAVGRRGTGSVRLESTLHDLYDLTDEETT